MGSRQEEPGGGGFGVLLRGSVVRADIHVMKPEGNEGMTWMAI